MGPGTYRGFVGSSIILSGDSLACFPSAATRYPPRLGRLIDLLIFRIVLLILADDFGFSTHLLIDSSRSDDTATHYLLILSSNSLFP